MWQINDTFRNHPIAQKIKTLADVFALKGELKSKGPLNEVIYLEVANQGFYVKRYYAAGKSLRRYIGRSRLRGEWENLLFFQQLQIPTPRIVAYGENYPFMNFKSGALITEAVENSCDLAQLPQRSDLAFTSSEEWLNSVVTQIAQYTKCLHQHQFVHHDLKCRNILVSLNEQQPAVYFFDCPLGRRRYGLFLQHGIQRDLEKLAQYPHPYLTPSLCKLFKSIYNKYENH